MEKLSVKGISGSSQIMVGESIDNLEQYVDVRCSVIITDVNVHKLYQKRFPRCPSIAIGLGESIKTVETISTVYSELINLAADRSTFIIGVGGGIVCDLAGFAASTYMRGTRFGFVATTLLAQVDASVGGKNGVNFGGYKNMVGVFNQPAFVICDLEMLKTLTITEIRCGFAEIIKHGAIADEKMLNLLENSMDAALDLDKNIIAHLVHKSVSVKANIVTQDELEQGERRKLNFGHTFGHAIEKLTGMSHGEAVGIGMILAAKASVKKGLLNQSDASRLEKIIADYGLPVQPPADMPAMLSAVKKDKKREGDRIHFVFLDALGSACVEEIELDELYHLCTPDRHTV